MIAILMSIYNGDKYLIPQLNSLLSQTYKEFIVYIHDDGSKDNSLNIIEEYVYKYPEKFVYIRDEKKNLGAANSFMYLLSIVDAEYYMFCDQDDIWLNDKVEVTYRCLKGIEAKYPNLPILVHTDLRVVDENLETLSKSFWKSRHFKIKYSEKFKYLPFGNIITGCTMMINKLSKDVSLPYSPHANMHDFWIGLMTAKYGLIQSLDKQTILYRRHNNNVTNFTNHDNYNFNIIAWYKDNKQLYDDIEYGSFIKIVFNRFCYFLIRHLL